MTLTKSYVSELLDAIGAGGDTRRDPQGRRGCAPGPHRCRGGRGDRRQPLPAQPGHTTWRNGARERLLATKAGDGVLRIPKLRGGASSPPSWSAGAASASSSSPTRLPRRDRGRAYAALGRGRRLDRGRTPGPTTPSGPSDHPKTITEPAAVPAAFVVSGDTSRREDHGYSEEHLQQAAAGSRQEGQAAAKRERRSAAGARRGGGVRRHPAACSTDRTAR